MKTPLLIVACLCAGSCYAQNYLDRYLTGTPVYATMADASNQVSQPRDLDFKPFSNELWIANKGGASGSSMVLVFNAGLPSQSIQYRKDSHTDHFMAYGSAMAFGDNGNWGSTGEIKNTATPSSTFMGPTLWSGDTSIFAAVFQNNWDPAKPLGSHLDMLHQSPFSMGIAHDSANVFWVNDGHNGNLCRYDFASDHSSGYDDHSNGLIWRYTDISLTREVNIPGHMVEDKSTGWLYIVDAGTRKLKRVNTNTGTVGATLTVPSTSPEALVSYRAVTGATVQVLDSFLSSQPTGVDVYNGRMIVSDYANGNIHLYDISVNPVVKLGTIATGQSGIMGVKIGPDGKIWFVNYTQNTVVRISPASTPTIDASIEEIRTPLNNKTKTNFYNVGFNHCANSVVPVVSLKNEGTSTLTTATIMYQIDNGTAASFSWTGSIPAGNSASVNLPSVALTDGNHKITAWVSNPNGGADANPANDRKEGAFRAKNIVLNYPVTERFSTTTFPPAGWNHIGQNLNNTMSHDATVGGFGVAANAGCVMMDNYNSYEDISGQLDYLMMPRLNMSGATSAAKLGFDVAYARYDATTNDGLSVRASTDCGASWTEIFNKSGATLATAPPSTVEFSPSATDWRTEVVSLSAYAGQSDVLLMFVMTSGHGNQLYLDNVNVSSTVNVKNTEVDAIAIYPNPTTGLVTVTMNNTYDKVSIAVLDILGREIKSINSSSTTNRHSVDLSEQPNGHYMIKVTAGEQTHLKKVSLVK